MNQHKTLSKYLSITFLSAVCCLFFSTLPVSGAVMNDYCVMPPFVSQPAPPMVMFEVGRDHKLYYEAYNDGVDLDGDGRIERTYDHSIEYYGYFNPYKCYTPPSGASSNDYFTPVGTNTDRFCSSGQWGGNILNWLSMSRMDVLRKVMYGGQRSQESPKMLLNRAYIPMDAHSWGKEYTGKLCYNSSTSSYKNMCYSDSDCNTGFVCTDKSVNLLGMSKPTGGDICSGHTITWGTVAGQGQNKLLVVRYPNTAGIKGTDHTQVMSAFDTTKFLSSFSPQYVTDFGDGILDPTKNHNDKYAQIVVSEFKVASGEGGTWTFAIDGDDAVEMEILTAGGGSTVVPVSATPATSPYISYYGSHGASNGQTHYGTYTLASDTWYRMVVRHNEDGGQDGVNVWYKKPSDTKWAVYGYKKGTLDVRAPDIELKKNECTLLSTNFITNGTPENTGVVSPDPATRHLICNTTLASGVPASDQATSILRLIKDSKYRMWEWASKERPVCKDTFTDGGDATANRTDYTVQVEVCKPGVGTLSMDDRFERCRSYGGTYNTSTQSYSGGSYVPVGLFQKYGEVQFDASGNEIKVCSKTMGKTCNTDGDCGDGEGLCFTKAPMYFGLMTTSYTKNTSGGVLRKNPGPVFDEVNNNNGKMQTSENERGNLINSINRLKIIDFDYGSHSYNNCGWITTRPMQEGECKMWGNPIAEMMYESLRYFAGKNDSSGGGATADFTYSDPADSGVSLSKPKWGYNKGSTYYKPFDVFPACSQPFMLLLSDVNTSFDGDQIPGSLFEKPGGGFFTEDTALPQLGLGETQASGKTLLNELADFIGQAENINGNNWFIGDNKDASKVDFICSGKTVANLSEARGICPEEPTKKGSYYAAALAYYGKTKFAGKTGHSPMSTFVVAMSSPFADIKVKATTGSTTGYINVVPVGKSVYGGGIDKCLGYGSCALSPTPDPLAADHATRNYKVSCPSTTTDAFCPTNSLVDFYIDDMKYDSSNNVIYSKFRINFEDVEQGADHDMDAIASYELCTQAASDAHYGSCTGTINGLQVKVKSEYAAGGISQLLGFIISGTEQDGNYLVVKDVDTGSGDIKDLPVEWSKTFTVKDPASSTVSAANYLKNPLWYAAKWGGFNGTTVPPTTSQWDKNNDGLPDTYFPVSNPLQLDEQLEKALLAILSRVSSGTAASILNNSEGSGANLIQAVFYPNKKFDNDSEVSWIGEMHNLWYYIDPFFALSTIRIDNGNYSLDLQDDYIATFRFDAASSQTLVDLVQDVNGNGTSYLAKGTYKSDDAAVMSLWKAGELLWKRDVTAAGDPRNIYTVKSAASGSALTLLSDNKSDAAVISLLQAANSTEAGNLIDYVHGIDNVSAGYRTRNVTMTGCGLASCDRVWKLGDIVNSTPKVESTVKLNTYDLSPPTAYGDSTYGQFVKSKNYQTRGMVFVGANDGMLHAFKLGLLDVGNQTKTHKATLRNADGTQATSASNLGREEWAFIPRNALPYLRYLADANYSHLFYVDNTSVLVDASVNVPTDNNNITYPNCDAAQYWNCGKKTVLSSGNIDMDKTSWRTILVGGMGLGGASKNLFLADGTTPNTTCTDKVATGTCVKTPIDNVGFSSYFALDVTNPHILPGNAGGVKLLWEFNGDPANGHYLGHATTGPAIVRVGGTNTNGRWFAVFANGPTGPIDTTTHAYYGKSDQNLKIFIVDLANGTLVKTIDTGIANAFAGSLSTAVIDTDRWNAGSSSFYSDDAIYIGYVKKDTTSGAWTKGGVLRVLTKGSKTPDTVPWAISKVIDDIGPVTTSVTKLQDRKALYDKSKATAATGKLWLYFGTGRYFHKYDSLTASNRVYGIQEPCYSSNSGYPSFTPVGPANAFDTSGTTTTCNTAIDITNLQDQSGSATVSPADTLGLDKVGWYLNLDCTGTVSEGCSDAMRLSDGYSSERVVTNPLASQAGAIFFTTFRPTADVCGFGGNAFVWAMRYDTGAAPPSAAMTGKVLMQVSTGAVQAVDLGSGFTHTGIGESRINMRRSNAIPGMPPGGNGLALVTSPKPTKRIMHYLEK